MGRRTRSLLFALVSVVVLAIPGQGLASGGSSRGNGGAGVQITHGPLVIPHSFSGNVANLPQPARSAPVARPEPEFDFGLDKQATGVVTAASVPRPTASMPAANVSFKGLDFRSEERRV